MTSTEWRSWQLFTGYWLTQWLIFYWKLRLHTWLYPKNIITNYIKIKFTAYKQLAKPISEYASASWDIVVQAAVNKLEAEQPALYVISHHLIVGWAPLAYWRLWDMKLWLWEDAQQGCSCSTIPPRWREDQVQLLRKCGNHHGKAKVSQYRLPWPDSDHVQRSFYYRTVHDWKSALPVWSSCRTSPAPC